MPNIIRVEQHAACALTMERPSCCNLSARLSQARSNATSTLHNGQPEQQGCVVSLHAKMCQRRRSKAYLSSPRGSLRVWLRCQACQLFLQFTLTCHYMIQLGLQAGRPPLSGSRSMATDNHEHLPSSSCKRCYSQQVWSREQCLCESSLSAGEALACRGLLHDLQIEVCLAGGDSAKIFSPPTDMVPP